jgi:murein DD-endopeptidase MepM/ murein hydrolase activator NlpD
MIGSKTELPAQECSSVTIKARSLQRVASLVDRFGGQNRILQGTRQFLSDSESLVSRSIQQSPIWPQVARLFRGMRAGVGDGSLLHRYALHLVVVLLAVAVVTIGRVSIPEVDLQLPAPTPAPELGTHSVTAPMTNRGVNRLISNNTLRFPAPVPHTTIAERERMQVITYTVQPNDNIWVIAQGFGLKAETVLWANPEVEKLPDLLSVGQKLVIPPVDGVYYTVSAGDTLEKLAKTYQISVDKIVSFKANGLEEPYTLVPGQKIMLPDGRKKVVPTNYYPMTFVGRAPAGAPTGSGRFAWPTHGYLSQRYWSGHLGIDIANAKGTPILAADDGYVRLAGRDTYGYGNQVVIDHGNGYYTRYAHLDKVLVKAGDTVKKNQKIGTMGSTGRSTGPHLHFEIIHNGTPLNPESFLR